LPPIDVVLISHNHYDHLDIESLKRLYERQPGGEPLILAGLGVSGLFAQEDLTLFDDLDWGDSIVIDAVSFTFVENRHRSGRGISDQMKTLWGSFVIQTSKGPIYFAGDTGYGPHFSDAYDQFGEFYLSLLPIGAYEPRWFMKDIHLNPEEAVKAHIDLHSSNSVSMHFGTFQLTHEGIDQPVKDLAIALVKHEINADVFRVLAFGETKEYYSADQAKR
jgi:L-ascorbate metabolism protein UlaG (beta-lactamase superfamily)